MAEHTPTPWAVETIKVEPDLGEPMLVKQVGGKKGDPYIADTFVGMEGGAKRSKAECEANAAFIVEAVNSYAARQWVRVEDEPPKEAGLYLVYRPGFEPDEIRLAWWWPKTREFRVPGWVSHWMEIPAPPAEP